MNEAKKLHLPPLAVPAGEITTDVTYEEYFMSAKRFTEEQSTGVDTKQLWARLLTRAYKNVPMVGQTRFLGPHLPNERHADLLLDLTVSGYALHGILKRAHDAIEGQREYMRSHDIERPVSEIGTVLPVNLRLLEMPQNMGAKGLVVSTYALNDHLARHELAESTNQ